jgi:hypothetical protein
MTPFDGILAKPTLRQLLLRKWSPGVILKNQIKRLTFALSLNILIKYSAKISEIRRFYG